MNVALSQYNHPWLIISSIHLIFGAKKFFFYSFLHFHYSWHSLTGTWILDFGILIVGEVCPHDIVTCPNCSPITSSSFPQPSVCHATLAGTAVAITQRVGIVNVMYYTASQILQYCTHDTSTLRILPFLPDPGWTFDFFTSSQCFARWGNPGL